MALDLERINKKAISESVADQLRDKILRGEVGVGERLPPERELAPAFGTNRNTLREAIRSLEAQGLVTVRQGDGVRVADFRTSGALSLLPELLKVSRGDERTRLVRDVLLMRRTMAVEVAGLAAERKTDDQLATLRRLLDQQREHGGDLLGTLTTDMEIYRTMVESTDSVIATLLFATLDKLAKAVLELFPQLLFVHPEYVDRMEAVIDAIGDGRRDDARGAMESLLASTDEVLVSRLG